MHTVTEEVTMTTPIQEQHDDNLVSWGILWGGYLIAAIACAYQVVLDRKAARTLADIEQGTGEASSGDTTRAMFYKLLLFALLSRVALIPVLISGAEFTIQFFADTFGYLSFASAWVLLVSFFVQLVGTASGALIYTGPSIVMQVTGYAVYAILCVTYFWNDAASILLFALLCCIYAALFATLIYFGPRLLTILRPSLVRRSGLALRLIASCVICIFVFASRTVFLARMVVDPPKHESWWWNYGCLELLPSVSLLIMMHPNRQPKSPPAGTPPTLIGKTAEGQIIQRNLSSNSMKRSVENGPLMRYGPQYGSTDASVQQGSVS